MPRESETVIPETLEPVEADGPGLPPPPPIPPSEDDEDANVR